MFCRYCLRLLEFAALAIVLLVLAGMQGCSHQVLTFFFTGVPEPGQEQVSDAERTLDEQQADRRAQSNARRQRANLESQTIQFVHGPFAARRCDACHVTSGGKQVRAADGSISTSKLVVGQRLMYPEEQLCLGCHSDKSPATALKRDLWQHGPAANALCTACHNPHASPRPFMLRKKGDTQMCGQCHSRDSLRQTVRHSSDMDVVCTDCHNPHVGRSSQLLRANYDERHSFGET